MKRQDASAETDEAFPTILVALGGNALLQRREAMDLEVQQRNVKVAAETIAALAERNRIVVTHGNGPQVGLLALQAESFTDVRPYTLDVLGAESEGMIGYLLEQAIGNELPDRDIATLLTQTVVSPDDPAFAAPTKPVGPVYAEAEARRLAAARGWSVARDGDFFRRVVSSPEPIAIVELRTIRLLLEAGVLIICTGGGGIPVTVDEAGGLRGVEAVIDKDLAASLLARLLEVDLLLLLTDVDAVYRDWGTPAARAIPATTPAELRSLEFASGSIGPKVEAACRFVEATGRRAGIGSLGDAIAIIEGERGTFVCDDSTS